MTRVVRSSLTLAVTLVTLGLGAAGASAQEKPSLAAEIRSVLESDGVEAAQQRFAELYPEHQSEYELDPQGFAEMGSQAMQEGDMATGQAIMQMVQQISQGMMAAQMRDMPAGGPPGAARMPTAQEQAEARQRREEERAAARQQAQEEREAERAAAVRSRLGEPRDDLERFAGIYGDPDAETARGLFVAVRCDGYLVVGATWGDAQDWYLRSLSDREFEAQTFGGETIQFTFTLSADGRPEALSHGADFLDTPLPYRSSLEEFGWPSDCVEPRGG